MPFVEFVGGPHDGSMIFCSTEPAILFLRTDAAGYVEAYDQPCYGCLPYFREGISSDGQRFTYTAWLNEIFRAERTP